MAVTFSEDIKGPMSGVITRCFFETDESSTLKIGVTN